MQCVPAPPWKEGLEVFLGLQNRLAVGEPPSLSKAMDMGVDGKRRLAECLGNHHLSCLMSNPGQGLEKLEGIRDLTLMFLKKNLGQLTNGTRLLWAKATRPDDRFNFGGVPPSESLRRSSQLRKKKGSDLVDALIGALGREKHSNQKSERIRVIKRRSRRGIKPSKLSVDPVGALLTS
jgi:hypothetical protein